MRAWPAVLLLLPALAGCVEGLEKTWDGEARAAPRIEGFTATYEKAGKAVLRLSLDGPHDRLGADLVMRPAYRVVAKRLDADPRSDWDARDADYFDGLGRRVRSDGCSIHSWSCERWSAHWRSTFVAGADVGLHGAFWPFSDSPSLNRSWRGETLIIGHQGPIFDGLCWEYEGTKPVPVRSCDGETRLATYERHELAPIPPWPDVPARPATGPHANELFPGADVDLQGHGFTTLEALAWLRANSAEAAGKLSAGGCIVTTLFGHGSGGFGPGPMTSLFETPVANTSFTVQDATGARTKYTVIWVEDRSGIAASRHFSSTVNVNDPDRQGGPTCDDLRSAPWPQVSAQEYLAIMEGRFGKAAEDAFEVTWQPRGLSPGNPLKYAYSGSEVPYWGGAAMVFDATRGAMQHASYLGPNDLEADENG